MKIESIKTNLKKAGAIATGALFLGATAMGAAAYDLSDYPGAFIASDTGNLDANIVVGSQGENAAGIASDVAGAVGISATLGQEAYKTTEKNPTCNVPSGTTTVEGGEQEEFGLQKEVSWNELDDTDVKGLKTQQSHGTKMTSMSKRKWTSKTSKS